MKVYILDCFLPYLVGVISLFTNRVVALEIKLSKVVVRLTEKFLASWQAENLLSIICLSGPIIFLPNVWAAWTANDISSMSNPTWAIMIVVHLSVYVRLAHDGASSCTRISILIWMLEMVLITLAILVR